MSAMELKIFGLLPLSSIVAGMRLSAAACRTKVPVAVEPVKPILLMPLLVARALPASMP